MVGVSDVGVGVSDVGVGVSDVGVGVSDGDIQLVHHSLCSRCVRTAVNWLLLRLARAAPVPQLEVPPVTSRTELA